LCYVGTAGFVGSFLVRRERNSSAIELLGIAAIALVLAASGVALMIRSGFWIGIFGVTIDGPTWVLVGVITALVATKKKHVT
jgi:CHASE2 domain-containing sensor protein